MESGLAKEVDISVTPGGRIIKKAGRPMRVPYATIHKIIFRYANEKLRRDPSKLSVADWTNIVNSGLSGVRVTPRIVGLVLKSMPAEMELEEKKDSFEAFSIISNWINIMKRRVLSGKPTLETFNSYQELLRDAWVYFNRKDPAAWKLEAVLEWISTLKRTTQFRAAVAMRSLRIDWIQLLKTSEYKAKMLSNASFSLAWRTTVDKLMNNKELMRAYFQAPHSHWALLKKLHFTLGSREGRGHGQKGKIEIMKDMDGNIPVEQDLPIREMGGILNVKWENVDWQKNTMNVFESKTKGGITWMNIPIDLIMPNLPSELRQYYESQGSPAAGRIFNVTIGDLVEIYRDTSKRIGINITPHFSRKLHASYLQRLGVGLEMVAGETLTGGLGIGHFGVGWDDLPTLKKYYTALSGTQIESLKNRLLGKEGEDEAERIKREAKEWAAFWRTI